MGILKRNALSEKSSRWLKAHGPLVCGLGCLSLVLLAMCGKPLMPAIGGAHLEVRRPGGALEKGSPRYERELQLLWFGSGCHVFQLGDASVLTDPFVSNGANFFAMESDKDKVNATFGRLTPPDGVLINHSHFDHFLDARAALCLPAWEAAGVKLYGGKTCANILAGWDANFAEERCEEVKGLGHVFELPTGRGYSLQVEAFPSQHTPHLKCGTTFISGVVMEARDSPPRQVWDYKGGEVFNYLVTLRSPRKTFRVFYLGAAFDLEKMPDSVPASAGAVDVVVLSVAGYDKVDPTPHLRRLQPRHVVFSHFNEFFKDAPDQVVSTLGDGGLTEVSRLVQRALLGSPRFEALHIPALTTMNEAGGASHVLAIR